jgi:soluble lytic murein transglycosylase-like protein
MPIPPSVLTDENIDTLFCLNGKKFGFPKLLLKAMAIIESNLDPMAKRFEQGFWDAYLKNNPKWKDKDPKVVSASYGLCQLMYVVAVELGFTGTAEELYDPNFNIALGAKLMRRLLDKVIAQKHVEKFHWLSPLEIALCRYNGGVTKNPDDKGVLRNAGYANRVLAKWKELKLLEKDCDD